MTFYQFVTSVKELISNFDSIGNFEIWLEKNNEPLSWIRKGVGLESLGPFPNHTFPQYALKDYFTQKSLGWYYINRQSGDGAYIIRNRDGNICQWINIEDGNLGGITIDSWEDNTSPDSREWSDTKFATIFFNISQIYLSPIVSLNHPGGVS